MTLAGRWLPATCWCPSSWPRGLDGWRGPRRGPLRSVLGRWQVWLSASRDGHRGSGARPWAQAPRRPRGMGWPVGRACGKRGARRGFPRGCGGALLCTPVGPPRAGGFGCRAVSLAQFSRCVWVACRAHWRCAASPARARECSPRPRGEEPGSMRGTCSGSLRVRPSPCRSRAEGGAVVGLGPVTPQG